MIIGNIRTHTDLAKKKSIAKDLLEIEIANEAENQKRIRNYKSPYVAKSVPPVYKTPSELRQDKDRLLRDAKEKLQSLGLDYNIIQGVINNYLNTSVDLLIKFNALFPSIRHQIQKNVNPAFANSDTIIDLIKLIMEDARNAYGFLSPTADSFQDLAIARSQFNILEAIQRLRGSMSEILEDGATYERGTSFLERLKKLETNLPSDVDFNDADTLNPIERKKFYDDLSRLFTRQQIPTTQEIDNLIDATASLQSNGAVLSRYENRFSHILPDNFKILLTEFRAKVPLHKEAVAKAEAQAVDSAIAGDEKEIARLEADLLDDEREYTPEEALNEVVARAKYKSFYRTLKQEEQMSLLSLIYNPQSDIFENFIGVRDSPKFDSKVKLIWVIVFEARELLGISPQDGRPFVDYELEEVEEEVKLAKKAQPLKEEGKEELEVDPIYSRIRDYSDKELQELISMKKNTLSYYDWLREHKPEYVAELAKKEKEFGEPKTQAELVKKDAELNNLFEGLIKGIIEGYKKEFGDDLTNAYAYDGYAKEERHAYVAFRQFLHRYLMSIYGKEAKEFDIGGISTEVAPTEVAPPTYEEGLAIREGINLEEYSKAYDLAKAKAKEESKGKAKKGRPSKLSEEEKEAKRADIEARKQESKRIQEQNIQLQFDANSQKARQDFANFKTELRQRISDSPEEGEALVKQLFQNIYPELSASVPMLEKYNPNIEAELDELFNAVRLKRELTPEEYGRFFHNAELYMLIANNVDFDNIDIPDLKSYRRRERIKGGIRKTSKKPAVPPLTYGLGMKKGRGKDSDSESDEEKGMGMKRIPIKTQEVKDFKPRRIKVGKGIDVEPEPTYKTFGKYVVHVPYLHNNTANFKYKSLGGIPAIKPMPISNEYKDFILDVLATGKMNEKDLRRLDKKEVKHFEKVVSGAGLNGHFKLNKSTDDEEVKDLARFELLRGEYLAGNNAPTLIKELRSHVLKFMDGGRIKRKDGMGLLAELSAV